MALIDALFQAGLPVFDLESDLPSEEAGWDSPLFHRMGRDRAIAINAFLTMGFNLLISDADVMWKRVP